MDERKKIIWRSLLLTILIFTIGILLNHAFDTFRIEIIEDVMIKHEIDTEAYQAERFFTDTFGGEACEIMITRISDLKKEIRQVGEDLGSYSRFSFLRKHDYDYLKRKYFLLQLKFLALIKKLNKECDKPYLPVLFFYEIDQDESERQGFILQDFSEDYDQQLIILSFDKDYQDEPLLSLLTTSYNVTTAPTIIIDEQKYTGLTYIGQLNSTVQKFLRRPDPYASEINFRLTPEAANISFETIIQELQKVLTNESQDNFAKADAQLAIGRLTQNETAICDSLQYYDQINSTNPEEMALVYETSAAIGCGRNRIAFLKSAAQEWRKTGNKYRAEILDKLSKGTRIRLNFDEKAINANITVITGYTTPITPIIKNTNYTKVTIGTTQIILKENDKILTQDDRVHRDWLSGQIANPYGPEILTTFSERLTYEQTELLPEIGWHEGARIKELQKIGITNLPAVGTLAAKYKEKWYAVDDKGIFRFEIPIDKISYPTTRFLRRDLAVIIDTHGMNMMVEQAIRNNAKAVIACCDHPGKIYAAEYLSQHNISAICYPDKYLYLAIGHDLKAIGSPPQKTQNEKAILGGRPITITLADKIVATNSTDESYALWYYQTPASYFETLTKIIPLKVTYVSLSEFGQMNKITNKAREINATIIATRVFNSDDYNEIKKWLDENPIHKTILFHSAPYPYGQKIFNEYPEQTTFDDPNPILK